MKSYKQLQKTLILFIGLHSILLQPAEESKSPEHSMQTRDEEITSYVNQYPHLEEGFDILQNIDASRPTFYNYLDANIVNADEEIEANIGEVIEQAENIISKTMAHHFYTVIKNEIDQLLQSQKSLTRTHSSNLLSSNRPIPILPRKTSKSHDDINGLNFYEIQDPIFQYVMQYKYEFMHPIIINWIQSNKENYTTLLDQAITLNHVHLAEFLLEMKIDPNSKMYKIFSLLGSAVSYQRAEIVNFFLAAGARTDITIQNTNYDNETLLTEATLHDDIPTVEVLLKYHTDLNIDNSLGRTPLLLAIERQNRELIQILLNAGANPNIPDILHDSTPIHFINAHSEIFDHSYNNHLANALPNFNINATERDIYGDTPLIVATHNNFIDIVRMLIEADANLNTTNIFYGTALQIAQRNNYIEIADMLLQAGAIEYSPAERVLPNTGNSFLQLLSSNNINLFAPQLSSNLGNRNYFLRVDNTQQNERIASPSFHQTLFDFDGLENDFYPMPELLHINETNDLFSFLDQHDQTLSTENHIPVTENLITQSEIETPAVDLFDFSTPTLDDQIATIETLTLQDAIEAPAAPADDQTQPKVTKRKRLQSSDESQVIASDKAFSFNNKKSK